jgi:hypothetical protein
MQSFPVQQPADAKTRRSARLTLILTSVLFGLLMIPGVGAMMISPMVFNAPESERNPTLVAFTVALVSYPILAFLSIIGSWVLYALKHYRIAMAVSLLPLLSMFAAFICFLLLEL